MIHSRMRPARLRPAMLAALWLVAALAACARLVEPPHDPRLVAAVEALAVDTNALFDSFAATAPEARAARYAMLAGDALAIATRAELRTAAMAVPPAPGPYAVATAGFMADYSRALDGLARADAAASAYGLPPQVVALRRATMTDALNDALIYERDLLNRLP